MVDNVVAYLFMHEMCDNLFLISRTNQVTQLVQEGFGGGDGKYPEGLRVELLKLGALLIEFMHKELLDHRKELIKFAWNNIKVFSSAALICS